MAKNDAEKKDKITYACMEEGNPYTCRYTHVLVTLFLFTHPAGHKYSCMCVCVSSTLPCSASFNSGSFCRISRIIIIIIVTFGTKTRSWELKKRWCFQFFVIVIRKGRTETLERQADKHRERENLSIRL